MKKKSILILFKKLLIVWNISFSSIQHWSINSKFLIVITFEVNWKWYENKRCKDQRRGHSWISFNLVLPDDIVVRCVCVSSRFVRCIPSRTIVSSRMFEVIFWPWHIGVFRVPIRAFDMNRVRVTQCRQWLHNRRVHGNHHVRFLKDK